MLPVIDNTLCNQVSKLLANNMPRVVPDQRDKFENEELFRKLSRESEVCLGILCFYQIYSPGRFLLGFCMCKKCDINNLIYQSGHR